MLSSHKKKTYRPLQTFLFATCFENEWNIGSFSIQSESFDIYVPKIPYLYNTYSHISFQK